MTQRTVYDIKELEIKHIKIQKDGDFVNKPNKALIALIFIVFFGVGAIGFKIADKVFYPIAKAQTVSYLCEKYNAKPNEFKMKDYNQAHLEWYDIGVFTQTPKWLDFSFEFEYKGRRFIACRNKGAIYDDYQLDDIEKWCTEWLQENVDNRITGVILDTRDILYYSSTTKKGYTYVITKAETENFLKNYKSVNDVKIFNYYDINGPVNHGIDEELNQKITFKIGNGVDCSADYSEKIITKEIDKSQFINWSSWYTVLSSIGE